VFSEKAFSIAYAEWLPQGPYTPPILALLKSVRKLQIDMRTGIGSGRPNDPYGDHGEAIAILRRHSIEPILNVFVGMPGDTEPDLIETLRHVFFLKPAFVKITRFHATPGRHESPDASETDRLLRLCRVSADSYNWWMKAAEKYLPQIDEM
jgi:hypothetical protein